jgi:hypothetical protein
VQKVFLGRPLPSAQINPLPPSTDNLGTTFNRLGKNPVMDSAVQVELQRQTKVIRKGASFADYPICTETGERMIRKLASGQYRLYSK